MTTRFAIDWQAAVWAALISGAVFLMLEMLMVRIFLGMSPWGPPHMIAAMVMGPDVLPQSGSWAPFDFGVAMVAMLVHFPLSFIYGVIGGWIVHRMAMTATLLVGAAFGLAIYLVNFLVVAPIAFPWFEMARNWVTIFAHIVFGVVLTGVYIRFRGAGNR